MADKNIRKLFDAALAVDVKIKAAEAVVDNLAGERSDAIKAIIEATGGKKGPFRLQDGSQVTIRSRKRYAKDDKERKHLLGETYFFVTQGDNEIIDV